MNRKVPIHPFIRPYIEQWYKEARNKKVVELNSPLISNSKGKKYDLKNFRSRNFYPLLLELGILELPEGEEKFSKRIADRIIAERQKARITTTTQLADVIASAYPAAARRD